MSKKYVKSSGENLLQRKKIKAIDWNCIAEILLVFITVYEKITLDAEVTINCNLKFLLAISWLNVHQAYISIYTHIVVKKLESLKTRIQYARGKPLTVTGKSPEEHSNSRNDQSKILLHFNPGSS